MFSAVLPQRWTHALVILGIMILYIAMAYLVRLTARFYVYDFMDTSMVGPLTAAYIFGIGGIGVAAFFVVQGLVWLKGVLGGGGVVKSRYDLPSRWGFDQRASESTQGTVEKGYVYEMRSR